jgi:hypothetical protein
MMPELETKKEIHYLTEVCVSLHEASHLAASLHSHFPVNYAEIIDVPPNKTAGNVHCFLPSVESDKTKAANAFVAMAAIAMTKNYHLTPFGIGGDWKNFRERIAGMQNTENVEKRLTWKAHQFVLKHRDQIFRLAHALQTRRRLDAEEAKRIYRGEEAVVVPRSFLDAVKKLPGRKWLDTDWEELRAFEQYFPGGKSGIQFPADNSKN